MARPSPTTPRPPDFHRTDRRRAGGNLHPSPPRPPTALKMANAVKPFSTIFLNLIRMVIAPFSRSWPESRVPARQDRRAVGAARGIYFEVITTLALLIGLVTVNRSGPARASRSRPDRRTWPPRGKPGINSCPRGSDIRHRRDTRGDVLQIVVFSIIFAIALACSARRRRSSTCRRLPRRCSGSRTSSCSTPVGVAAAIATPSGRVLNTLLDWDGSWARSIWRLPSSIWPSSCRSSGCSRFHWQICPGSREPALIAFSTTS